MSFISKLDMVKTGQNLKRIMQLKGYTVKDGVCFHIYRN